MQGVFRLGYFPLALGHRSLGKFYLAAGLFQFQQGGLPGTHPAFNKSKGLFPAFLVALGQLLAFLG